MTKPTPRGPRAPNKSAEKSVNLRMTFDLHKRAAKAAHAAGVNLLEWIREAMRRRLDEGT